MYRGRGSRDLFRNALILMCIFVVVLLVYYSFASKHLTAAAVVDRQNDPVDKNVATHQPAPARIQSACGESVPEANTALRTSGGSGLLLPPNFSKLLSLSIFFILPDRVEEIRNLRHFCLFGIAPNDPNVDYWLVLTSSNDIMSSLEAMEKLVGPIIPLFVRSARNVKITWHSNGGTDLCIFSQIMHRSEEWHEAMSRKHPTDPSKYYYSHVWFMNGTVRGPFLPIYLLEAGVSWWASIINILEANPPVDVVGGYGSCDPVLHLQTMSMMLNRNAVNVLNSTFYCQRPSQPRLEWIMDTEVVRLFPKLLNRASIQASSCDWFAGNSRSRS